VVGDCGPGAVTDKVRRARPSTDRGRLEAAISSDEASRATRLFIDEYRAEDEHLEAARSRADEIGLATVAPATGAVLRWLCQLVEARTVAEIGSGAGVSGLWMLGGMTADGILTTVDEDGESTRAARRSFGDAGIPTQRVRLITGRPLEVLSRLADGGYDLAFFNGDVREYDQYLEEGLRLLRPGGIVAFEHALADGKVPDPAQRDPSTVAVRLLVNATREDERIQPLLLPVGDGLLVARKVSAGDGE
jgi:predicted O-methyltransferase YrrM